MKKWVNSRFGDLATRLLNGGTPSTKIERFWTGKTPWITGADFCNQKIEVVRRYVSDEAIACSPTNVVPAGNLLMVTRTGVGKMAIAPYDIAISQDITGILFKDSVHPHFMFYKMQHEIGYFLKLNQGTSISGITKEDLLNFRFSFPESLPEQRRIAEILGTVDAEIEQTEALLAKYQRLKTGLLAELLTHGLDAQGQRRSPQTHEYKTVEGMTVPAEWEVKRLGDIAAISSGVTLGKTYEGAGTVELPYLRVANVQDGYLNLSEVTTIRLLKSQVDKFLLENGDVLMNEGGDFDKLGRGTVWRGEIKNCLHQNHVFKVRSNRKKLLPDYLAYVSGSAYGKRFFVLNSKQSTNLASINSTQLNSFPIPLPSVQEQKLIIDSLGLQNESIVAEQQRLQKLHALKKGLMQHLLSGPEAENAG